MVRRISLLALIAFCSHIFPEFSFVSRLSAATLPANFTETQIAGGLANPTAMAFAPDGRLFVCLQGGQVRVIKNGSLLPTPFLSLTVDSSGERGLLGIAFDPNFATNQFVYVYYTVTTSPALHNRVSRFTANGDVAVAGSEFVVLNLNNLSGATNHNGGAIHFGEDGKLYAAVGDNANGNNSQTLGNLLGKILRVNADGTIPTDNPFFLQATGQNRAIWALGLRNPFTFAFQPMTGRMFINDVGQSTFEEINEGIAGANYGWPNSEGPTSNPNHTGPIYYYGHGTGAFLGCAITGGVFYNPTMMQFPAEYAGDYFFADFCGGWINKYDVTSGAVTTFASGISLPVDLHLSSDGSLYYLARGGGGAVYRVQFAGNQAPTITQHPQSQTVGAGQPVTFTVMASGDQPLTYQWQRNGVNIPRARSSSYIIKSVQPSDNGALFRCVVSNAAGTAISNEALLTVAGTNLPPVAEANGPYGGVAGRRITFSSSGTNDSDGTISSYSWNFGDGSSPSTLANPQHIYAAAGTYTATLTVTDNQGATDTDTAQVTVK